MLMCVHVLEGLQKRLGKRAGLAAHEDCIFCGAPWALTRDFQDKNSRSSLCKLYLAMALLKSFFWEHSPWWKPKISHCATITLVHYFLLEVLLLVDLFWSFGVVFGHGYSDVVTCVWSLSRRFLFLLLLFWLCLSLMSYVSLLVQRPNAIDIFIGLLACSLLYLI
jgi:hypothetical protein